MPKNLEIKAKSTSLQTIENIARSINARFVEVLEQVDTYFSVSDGRLKLREINGNQSELIYYKRNESAFQRLSDFIVYPVDHPGALRELLSLSLGIKVKVEKKRMLYMLDSTRIHLDEVRGLGIFLEFEVPIEKTEQSARETMNFLIQQFGIKEADYIKESYSDLLLKY